MAVRWRRWKTLATSRWGTRPPCRRTWKREGVFAASSVLRMHPATKGCRRKAATNAQAGNISRDFPKLSKSFPRAFQGTRWVLARCWLRIGKPVSGRTTFRDTRFQHRPFCEPAAVPRAHWQGSDAGPSTDQPIQNVQRTLEWHVFHTRSCRRTGSRNGVLSEKKPFCRTAPGDSDMPVVGPMTHVLFLLHPPILLLTILLKEREKEPRRIQGVGSENWPAGACQTVPRRVH